MPMIECDPLLPCIRIREAAEHLSRARETLTGEDDELIDLLGEIACKFDTVNKVLEAEHEDTESRWQEGDA